MTIRIMRYPIRRRSERIAARRCRSAIRRWRRIRRSSANLSSTSPRSSTRTKPVDATIGARTKQFNDVVVAFPPANAGLVTVTNTPDGTPVVAGNALGFTIAIANSSGGAAVNGTLQDPLPAGTGVSWSISPAYAGPGTCAINGAVGAQELDCTFGSIAVNTSFTIHVVSASSSAGTYTDAASVTVTNQQVLSIGTITVHACHNRHRVLCGFNPVAVRHRRNKFHNSFRNGCWRQYLRCGGRDGIRSRSTVSPSPLPSARMERSAKRFRRLRFRFRQRRTSSRIAIRATRIFLPPRIAARP